MISNHITQKYKTTWTKHGRGWPRNEHLNLNKEVKKILKTCYIRIIRYKDHTPPITYELDVSMVYSKQIR